MVVPSFLISSPFNVSSILSFSFNANNIADTTKGFSVSVKLPLDVKSSFNSFDFSNTCSISISSSESSPNTISL